MSPRHTVPALPRAELLIAIGACKRVVTKVCDWKKPEPLLYDLLMRTKERVYIHSEVSKGCRCYARGVFWPQNL